MFKIPCTIGVDTFVLSMEESDEKIKTKNQALRNLREKILEYKKGDETMGVVSMYERTCLKMGCTNKQVDQCWDLSVEPPSY